MTTSLEARDRLLAQIAALKAEPIGQHLGTVKERISMMHEDVLIGLYLLARETRGSVLEIGAYIGGSTVALAAGVRDSGVPRTFLCIEKGGAHLIHPTIPSEDIFADLGRNIERYGLLDHVELLNGWSCDEAVIRRAEALAGARPLSLLSIDADGKPPSFTPDPETKYPASKRALFTDMDLPADCYLPPFSSQDAGRVTRDLARYLNLCEVGAHVFLDDYAGDEEKVGFIRGSVDTLVGAGILEPVAVLGWGTWLGRLRQRVPLER